MIRVGHIITGLEFGGAETMLSKVLGHLPRAEFDCEVISLTKEGPVAEQIRKMDVPVSSLNMSRGAPNPMAIWRLRNHIRSRDWDVVQAWLPHAALLGGLAARVSGRRGLVWGLYQSSFEPSINKASLVWLYKVCAAFSKWLPDRVVFDSEVARKSHVDAGYRADITRVILNGFDLSRFKPDTAARLGVRDELGLPASALLIGCVARFDPYKDHETLIKAAGLLHREVPDAWFLFCGGGMTKDNAWLMEWIRAAGIEERALLLGPRSDVPRITAALDIATLSSHSESLPNVIGEAMACGVPCAATGVGMVPEMIGDTGAVVPVKDFAALAAAFKRLIQAGPDGRRKSGEAARQRIASRFGLEAMVRGYRDLYQEVLKP